MRKLALLVTAILLISCSEEEEQSQNCNCDRVVKANTFNVVGTPQNPALNYYTVYTTINDCTGVQRQKTHSTTNSNDIPSVGDCR